MDHHCPFLNNCVGRGNVRPFLLFLFWVVVGMLYALPLLFYSVIIHKASIVKVCTMSASPNEPGTGTCPLCMSAALAGQSSRPGCRVARWLH
jgi:hypothetical protein